MSYEEFETHIDDARLVAYLRFHGLDVRHRNSLFDILDEDLSGSVHVDEFVQGCQRLTGNAKSLDLEFVKRDIEALKLALMPSLARRRETLSRNGAETWRMSLPCLMTSASAGKLQSHQGQ